MPQDISFNSTNGAGLINLPTNGTVSWGKVSVSNGGVLGIPLNVGSGNSVFDGALWWSEAAAQIHNDVDSSSIDPNGVVVASSVSILSVFERARASGLLIPGTWTLRIRGFSVPTAPHAVYYSAHISP
jgi:hypothetical protein